MGPARHHHLPEGWRWVSCVSTRWLPVLQHAGRGTCASTVFSFFFFAPSHFWSLSNLPCRYGLSLLYYQDGIRLGLSRSARYGISHIADICRFERLCLRRVPVPEFPDFEI
jgi:hypothetical protein